MSATSIPSREAKARQVGQKPPWAFRGLNASVLCMMAGCALGYSIRGDSRTLMIVLTGAALGVALIHGALAIGLTWARRRARKRA